MFSDSSCIYLFLRTFSYFNFIQSLKLLFIVLQLIYNIVLVSSVQQNDSVIYIYPFSNSFLTYIIKNIKQSSQCYLQNYSNQNCVILTQKQKYRTIEQNRKTRNKPMHLQSVNPQPSRQDYMIEKTVSSVKVAGKTEQLHV